jgi:hypothetical protein
LKIFRSFQGIWHFQGLQYHVRKAITYFISELRITYFTSELRIPPSCALPTNSYASLSLQLNMSQPTDLQSAHREGRIALALQAYKTGYFTSLRAAANAYDIPESTFRSRLKGTPSRHGLRPTNTKLSATEETALIKWILSMDKRGLPVRSRSI